MGAAADARWWLEDFWPLRDGPPDSGCLPALPGHRAGNPESSRPIDGRFFSPCPADARQAARRLGGKCLPSAFGPRRPAGLRIARRSGDAHVGGRTLPYLRRYCRTRGVEQLRFASRRAPARFPSTGDRRQCRGLCAGRSEGIRRAVIRSRAIMIAAEFAQVPGCTYNA